ncbi:hypothetical protein SARC_05099 [Sphaeroforma arctica JP610]|uniref:LicD/FKTN/FKRP nucleotidyltransferase domain-containing protein n=1 Tax=Sphaeroforma arctica JP610 TaxID=667725 RepID=A0A0L0G0P1_9EUKA|nr:hypothetical protein SARC_05099 [Sphaeroforma arctica JP610]KNC82625.1 hypothetical protein SARC_05099 [Sphaeroforma arctica JP610]|eukprot:XP_014156527.1 hypothetical protein SARC_05099 [Sphaeroforma arctica JP610]
MVRKGTAGVGAPVVLRIIVAVSGTLVVTLALKLRLFASNQNEVDREDPHLLRAGYDGVAVHRSKYANGFAYNENGVLVESVGITEHSRTFWGDTEGDVLTEVTIKDLLIEQGQTLPTFWYDDYVSDRLICDLTHAEGDLNVSSKEELIEQLDEMDRKDDNMRLPSMQVKTINQTGVGSTLNTSTRKWLKHQLMQGPYMVPFPANYTTYVPALQQNLGVCSFSTGAYLLPQKGNVRHKAHLHMLAWLRSIGILYSIEDGSAIGVVRHGGLIPGDKDMDLQISMWDNRRLLEKLGCYSLAAVRIHDLPRSSRRAIEEQCKCECRPSMQWTRDELDQYTKVVQIDCGCIADAQLLDNAEKGYDALACEISKGKHRKTKLKTLCQCMCPKRMLQISTLQQLLSKHKDKEADYLHVSLKGQSRLASEHQHQAGYLEEIRTHQVGPHELGMCTKDMIHRLHHQYGNFFLPLAPWAEEDVNR